MAGKGLVTETEYLEMVTARLRLVGKSMEENLDLLAEEARVKQEMALLNEMLAGTESARLQKQRDEMAKAVEWLEKGLVTEAGMSKWSPPASASSPSPPPKRLTKPSASAMPSPTPSTAHSAAA